MYDVRPATAADLPGIAAIQDSGLALFEEAFGDLTGDVIATPSPHGEKLAAQPGFLLVAGDPAVGFVHVVEIEGHAHLEQVSVLPSAGRQGVGAALVCAAVAEASERGFDQITLTSYADLPWNGQFYERMGFAEVEPTGYLAAIREREQEVGLDRHGRRIVMRAERTPLR